MRKYLLQPHIILAGLLILLALVYNLTPPNSVSGSAPPPHSFEKLSPTPSPPPAADISSNPKALAVRDTLLSIGDRIEDVIRKLGSPGRIAETEFDFQYYIYNNDYKRLLFIAVLRNRVVGFYTDSGDFEYLGLRRGSTLEQVEHALTKDYDMSEVLNYDVSDCSIRILMDRLETGTVTGIYVLSSSISEGDYEDTVITHAEQMVYDLTNSFRAHNGLSPLSWSSSAGIAARKHSLTMAEDDFFGHRDPARRSPGDRLKAEGISYRTCGENIIAGYEGAILSVHGWYNCTDHRKNLLHTGFRYLGVGIAYDENSRYQIYITQNFYR